MTESPPLIRQLAWVILAPALAIAVASAGLVLGSEAVPLAFTGMLIAPFLIQAALLQLCTVWPGLRPVTWASFWLLLLAIAIVAFGMTLSALGFQAGGPGRERDMAISSLVFGVLAAGLVGSIALAAAGTWVRLGRWLLAAPDPRRADHAQALIGLIYFTLAALVPLWALGGQAPLLELVSREALAPTTGQRSDGAILNVVYQFLWVIPLALLAAGVPLRRQLAEGVRRLGFLPVRRNDLLVLSAIALALVGLAFAADLTTRVIWDAAGWPRTDAELVKRLFGEVTSPIGALGVGISAGVGEELIVRGLLQPRLGWFLPNLAFTAGHGFQYGADGLTTIFLIGAVFAFVRSRWNTTAAAFTHALYDFLLIFAAALGVPGF